MHVTAARVPRVPADVKEGVMLHTTFLVRTDGDADTASVTGSVTAEPAYRGEPEVH